MGPPVVIALFDNERGEFIITPVPALRVRFVAVVVIPVGVMDKVDPRELIFKSIAESRVLDVDNSALLTPLTKNRPFVPVRCILTSILRELVPL